MKNKNLLIIDQIEKIRSKNNKNWMDLLRLAFVKAPTETTKIMSEIFKHDEKIASLIKKLTRNVY